MASRIAAWLLAVGATISANAQDPKGPMAIFVMDADGGRVRKVAQADGYYDHACPRWSHDGKQLAFHATLGPGGPRACFIVNVDGSGLTEICKGRVPEWSPDDKQIVFQTDFASDRVNDVYVQNIDGRSRTKIALGCGPRWSPDGSKLALTDRHLMFVKDMVSGEQKSLFAQSQQEVFDGFCWTPDGKRIALVARPAENGPRHLLIVDAERNTKSLEPRLRGEFGGFVSFAPDGKRLLLSDNWKLRVVEVDGNAAPRELSGQEGLNRHPAYSPDGKMIAFASSRTLAAAAVKPAMPTAKVLKELRRHDRRSIVWSVDFLPDGRKMILGGQGSNSVQLWDLTTGETRDLGGLGMLVQVFPDGKRFASAWTQRVAHIVDLQSGEVLKEFDHGGRIWAFALSPDGRKLLTGGLDKIFRIWDIETGEMRLALDPLPDYATRAYFSADSKEIIAGCHDLLLRVIDATTGKQRLALAHPEPIWGLAVSPDGRHVVSGTGGKLYGSLSGLNVGEGQDNVLRMWDLETGKLVREMKGHEGGIFCADVSPDGRLAVTGSTDSTLRLWDLTTGAELSKMGPGKGLVACVRFSPDGKQVFAGGGVNRMAGNLVEFPNERVRVYNVLDASEAAAAKPEAQ